MLGSFPLAEVEAEAAAEPEGTSAADPVSLAGAGKTVGLLGPGWSSPNAPFRLVLIMDDLDR